MGGGVVKVRVRVRVEMGLMVLVKVKVKVNQTDRACGITFERGEM